MVGSSCFAKNSLTLSPTHSLVILFQFLEFHNNRDGSRKLIQTISSKKKKPKKTPMFSCDKLWSFL